MSTACRSTADRYIDFRRIIKAYPRLLICDLSFETIISMSQKLIKYLETDVELETRLKVPLRSGQIHGTVVLLSSSKLPGDGDAPPPSELVSASAAHDWAACWQLADEIVDSRECK